MANTDGPWVRFFASDWLAGTRGMTAAETGVYITLIATMYERAEPLPRDDSRLARVCGLPTRNFAAILDQLIADGKITLVDGANLWGRKVDLEVSNRSARAERGRLAATAKHEQKQSRNSASAPRKQPASSSQTVPRARTQEPEPDSKDEESLEAPQRKRAARLPPEWAPSEADKDWLRSKWPGVTSSTYSGELEKFRNYWLAKSGKDATKVDWSRTWQNWMITAMERTGSRPASSSTRKPSAAELATDLLAQMEAADRERDAEAERDHPPAAQYAITGPR
jgi:uncharacterized protein YdaU (DUF1376 family)